ncbi:MAG: aconitate hydratase [Deltaproteobacteria bacterium]|nr:MAG: aconitate hydratase [Deltaproteobacteria bacterium]
MGKNIVQKIIDAHLVSGEPVPGKEVGIRIDQTLTQDATGTMVYLQFESMGIPRVRTELSVSYVDHNTLQEGFENADDHLYLQTVAAKYGIYYSKAGNGICHQVHLERFGAPGKTLLGSDSHTPTNGGIGMLAIGAGGLDVAIAMAGGPFYLTYPKVLKVNLTGKLRPFVSAKDVILKLLEILTTKGNVGWVVEYGGEGVKTLSVPERATITNMGAELGVTTSIFPSDEITRAFLRAQGREEVWVPLEADPDAEYDRVIDLNLSELEPMVAQPHSPDNVVKVRDIAGLPVDQVLIGSCTNSSYKDVTTVAKILEGRKVHPRVSFGVAPGSRQVLLMATKESSLATLVEAGARILESTCGFCIGAGQAPPSKGVSVRTNNRNFFGRSGTKDAGVYLVSPETAAACALKGEIADPRDVAEELGIEYPDVQVPEKFIIDDSMIIPPAEDPATVEIRRGPNIGNPPEPAPLPDAIRGEVTLKVGDKITTDHIMPAGSRLKYRSNIPKYATFVFETVDPEFHKRALENKEKGVHNVIVGGMSYGQGSSREHAAICPSYLGVRAVIAKSFERIHSANLVNFGIIPLLFVNESDYDRIDQGDRIELPSVKEDIQKGDRVKAVNATKGYEFELTHTLSQRQIEILLAGGRLAYTKQKGAL